MHVRVLVAAYLFQTGYGHFSFFWLKGDFGLYRVCQVSVRSVTLQPGSHTDSSRVNTAADYYKRCVVSRYLRDVPVGCFHCGYFFSPSSRPLQVLFRLNFLVLVLCVVMDRPYQFYYFVPLVTFWFVVIYGTLAMWPQILQKKANSRCRERELQMFLVSLQWK